MKTKYLVVFISLVFELMAGLPKGEAVVPPPDGGYPGGNTAEGDNALLHVNTAIGINNTAVGANALRDDTTGYYNVAVGSGALASNTTGNFNMAIGAEALTNNNSNFNLAIGFRVGYLNTTGNHLTGIGAAALRNNTTGSLNTAIGADAMRENTTGGQNTATGAGALSSHVSGADNTAIGTNALFSDATGQLNTAIGAFALFSNVGGPFPGSFNTAVGGSALFNNTGGDNTAIGAQALQSNTTGIDNTAIGVSALVANESGNRNIALGSFAGRALTTGSDNIYIGFNLGGGTAGESNACYIKSIFGQTNNLGAPVFIDANHKLGTLTSSKRFKQDIQQMSTTSEALFALKPITFHYKKEIDPAGKSQFGLVAEDVEKVNPDLVVRDKEGKPYSVRYDQVNAMLLNEFLKEHRKVEQQGCRIQEQEVTITELKSEMKALIATVKEQAAQIRRVSDQVAVRKPVAQIALSNP